MCELVKMTFLILCCSGTVNASLCLSAELSWWVYVTKGIRDPWLQSCWGNTENFVKFCLGFWNFKLNLRESQKLHIGWIFEMWRHYQDNANVAQLLRVHSLPENAASLPFHTYAGLEIFLKFCKIRPSRDLMQSQ